MNDFQDFSKASVEVKAEAGRLSTDQYWAAYNDIGVIKLSKRSIAMFTFIFLFWKNKLLIEKYALLALAKSSLAANSTEPDG